MTAVAIDFMMGLRQESYSLGWNDAIFVAVGELQLISDGDTGERGHGISEAILLLKSLVKNEYVEEK